MLFLTSLSQAACVSDLERIMSSWFEQCSSVLTSKDEDSYEDDVLPLWVLELLDEPEFAFYLMDPTYEVRNETFGKQHLNIANNKPFFYTTILSCTYTAGPVCSGVWLSLFVTGSTGQA